LDSLRHRKRPCQRYGISRRQTCVAGGNDAGEITEAECVTLTRFLAALPIETDTEGKRRAHGAILTLARLHRLGVYDAIYLDVTQRRGLPLATHDQLLEEAARESGVPLIET
jgi:predicted nucleic acid-binding protein